MKALRIIVLAVGTLLVAACPRIAHLDVYNDTVVELEIVSVGETVLIEPDSRKMIPFPSNSFSIKSELGEWTYDRNMPHTGENGEFFDGILRIQVNGEGQVFAYRRGEDPKVAKHSDQPDGFPLLPTSP